MDRKIPNTGFHRAQPVENAKQKMQAKERTEKKS